MASNAKRRKNKDGSFHEDIPPVVCLPLVLGVVFVIAPCYLFGFFGWAGPWCGYKSESPHMQAQFITGLATGFVIAFFGGRRRPTAGG
ncbi:MAG: hypothetical protein LAP21_09095 [Acidobacteriia bacterium]|nr:hypothetical protein [Terriglobia bacterium]